MNESQLNDGNEINNCQANVPSIDSRIPMHRIIDRKWTQGDIHINRQAFTVESSEYFNKNPVELFELMFSDNLCELFVSESNNYAVYKGGQNPNITLNEMKCFIGILLLTGYNSVPQRNLYWSYEKDVQNALVRTSMRRDRFIQIMSSLHCCDVSNVDLNDKLYKLRPMIDILKENFHNHFIPQQNLSFDESMVKYFGRHSCKQFIRGKPIRFGYKVWCLNTENGYLLDFDIYTGKNSSDMTSYDKSFGKPAAVLARMIDIIPYNDLPYNFYFDNLFTSVNLLSHLKEKGYGGTGTIRINRVPKNCKLPTKESFRKEERGKFYGMKSIEDELMLIRWKDNSIVTIGSNIHGIEPTETVRRYSSADKNIINVKCPNAIVMYNKCMGGTDRMDEDINSYRIGLRGKKWYWPLLTWMIDTCMNNAWMIYKRVNDTKLSNLEFRRFVVKTYLSAYGTLPSSGGRPSARSFIDKR